jgi:hypothetical protein
LPAAFSVSDVCCAAFAVASAAFFAASAVASAAFFVA